MWYVIQVQTGREEQIMEEARSYQVQEYFDEIFAPHYERKKKYLGQWHMETALLFPGYLFVISSHPEELYKALKRIPQLTRLLGTGEKWTPMTDEDIETKGSIREVENEVGTEQFFRCNKCYLINLEYVDSVQNNDIRIGGDVVRVSRARKKEFMDVLNNYINEVSK